MDNYIICHYGKSEYLYNLETKKYYLPKQKINVSIKESQYINSKLKEISAGFEWRVNDSLADILEATYLAHSMRQHYRFDLYQTPILPESSVRRATLIKKENQKVVLIGDDDLVSIPLALMGHQVTVLDADEYLISLIEEINKRLNIDIQVLYCNLVDELDDVLKEQFDVMYTDPVSTMEGYEVFVKRGFELLGEGGEAFITVTERFRPVLNDFLEKCNIQVLESYNAFCNSYNHKIELIDDVADMVKVRKSGKEKFKSISSDTDFFRSQRDMRYFFSMELFGIDSEKIDNQIQTIVNYLRNSIDKVVQISKFTSTNNVYYFIFADKDEFKLTITIYDNTYIEIAINAVDEMNIGMIKRTILTNVSFRERREESFVCGLPFIKGHVDMDINYLN